MDGHTYAPFQKMTCDKTPFCVHTEKSLKHKIKVKSLENRTERERERERVGGQSQPDIIKAQGR